MAAKRGKTAKKKVKKAAGSKRAAGAKRTTAKKKAPAKRRAAAKKTVQAAPVATLDHIGIPVSDYAKSKAFYTAALAPLGIDFVMEFGTSGGFGANRKPDFWIGEGHPHPGGYWLPQHKAGAAPVHVAFVAKDRAAVDAFFAAAIGAGGIDNGPPGLRPDYHAGYYGAFVLDPDGHNVEAVHHTMG
jgi:catechol 2,3-dioxygenase-like lactoylglutathione lyase family enzyme